MLAVGMLSLAFLDKLICTVNIFLLRIPIELFMKGRVVEKTKGQNSQDPLRRGRRGHHIPLGVGHLPRRRTWPWRSCADRSLHLKRELCPCWGDTSTRREGTNKL